MLEKPNLQDEKLIACLQDAYGLQIVHVTFLPLGADPNTAVYRAITADSVPYFVKLRSGVFDETSVALPKLLSDQGIAQIIPPVATQTGKLWANLEAFTVILYPFVAGRNGYEVNLSDNHWRAFGTALKRIHTAPVPPGLRQRIQRERYSAQGRESVRMFLTDLAHHALRHPIAQKLAAFLQERRAAILDLVGRAERLAQRLQANAPALIVCHSDLHAGNILIDSTSNFYIVDWDNPILAPKERDLMFVGGGQGFTGHTAQEEETLFYQGYGETQINPIALAYYRYERIVQDIAVYCEELLLTDEGEAQREQSLHYLMSNFLPNGTIDLAYGSDKSRDVAVPRLYGENR